MESQADTSREPALLALTPSTEKLIGGTAFVDEKIDGRILIWNFSEERF